MNRFKRFQRSYLAQMFDDGAGANDDSQTKTDTKDQGNKNDNDKNGKPKDDDKGNNDGKKGDEKKYSDADLDKIIADRRTRWEKEQKKAVDEAKKLADMDAQQKAEYERDKLQKELDELKKANTLAEMQKQARKMLADEEINLGDDLVAMLVTDEAKTTQSNIQQFTKLYKAAVQDGVKQALKGKAPGTGSSSGAMTKEQIMKVKDRAARQKLINEHKNLFR